MRFRAHDTFFIRRGWLNKGMKNVKKEPAVFMGASGNPMDVLGIGANMVKALRYWLLAVGLTSEPSSGRKEQHYTPFGALVYENDPYFEEVGTLWLLHYKLATNMEEATAWYFFFNKFGMVEFSRDDFVRHLSNFVRMKGTEVSERSLEDDFNCIINTYISRTKSSPDKVDPESNIDCPLGELGLVDIQNRKSRVYRKSVPKKDTLPPLILLSAIVDQAGGQIEHNLTSLHSDACSAGKVFNLDMISLMSILYRLELMGYLKVIRTSGLDVVRLEKDLTFLDCVAEYYRSISRIGD